MRAINIYTFYELGLAINRITNLPSDGCSARDLFMPMMLAFWQLDKLKGAIDLSTAHQPHKEVVDNLRRLQRRYFIDEKGEHKAPGEESVQGWEISSLKNDIEKFEHVLSAETSLMATYYANKIGIFDTADLVGAADKIIPESVRALLPPTVVSEIQQAGRALAFELPTASAFHTCRAVELVLRSYAPTYSVNDVTRAMGLIINDLETKTCEVTEPTFTATLRQLKMFKDFDRNPTMHPQNTLDSNQAMILLFNGVSALNAMITERGSTMYRSSEEKVGLLSDLYKSTQLADS